MNLRRNLAVELILILVVTFESAASYSQFESRQERSADDFYNEFVGEPLYLTPVLDADWADSARKEAKVTLDELQNIESYAGYFTVDDNYDSNLFFWYFPAKENSATAPVILYLENGPSLTMMFGLSLQNGPFSVDSSLHLKARNESWNNKHNLIYIDSPIGTGYSFTNSRNGYSTTFGFVAHKLLTAMKQFFQLFPSLRENDFFVAGQGHAAKTILELSHSIYYYNRGARHGQNINLKGIVISSGIVDSIEQLDKSEYFYNFGLVDDNGRDQLLAEEKQQRDLILGGQYTEAAKGTTNYYATTSLFAKLTGYYDSENLLTTTQTFNLNYACMWVQSSRVRRNLHVGDKSFVGSSAEANNLLTSDMYQFKKKVLADVLEKYPVLIYTGQLDLITPYYSVRNYLQKLSWFGSTEFNTAKRQQWRDTSGKLAGYITKGGNLIQVLVRNAGHFTSLDQPQWTLELVEKFTHGLL